MRKFQILLPFILSLSLFAATSASATPQADVTGDQPVITFPNAIKFRAKINSDAIITSVILEYGTDQLTCGDVVAKAFPQFASGKSVDVEWTWDMRQSGSLPPGATIWWRWRFTDENGKETLSEQKTITWLDNVHPWQTITSGQLRLHWYGIGKSFAQEMLKAGLEGLNRNEKQAGLKIDASIDLYVYPNYNDLGEAILYEPSWTGGLAFPEENIVIMGTSESNSSWDKDTVIHELTHVLVGHFTFTCLGYVPQWLDEGLAVYSEGTLDDQFQIPFDRAIQENKLLSIRVISGAFAEVRDNVDLSYAQSYSIVNFLIQTYGQDKMTNLLTSLRDGTTIDDALRQTYRFNVEGLEDAWRKAIQAQPRPISAQPTAQPTPTYVPTIVPVSGALLTNQMTATTIPTSSFDQNPAETPPSSRTGPPIALTLALLGFCCIFLLIIGVIALGITVRNQNRKGGNNG